MRIVFCLFFLLAPFGSIAQGFSKVEEENFLLRVKQIDEFIERFNNEKTLLKEQMGIIDSGKGFRDRLILSLFDQDFAQRTRPQVFAFIQNVTDFDHPVFLNFYDTLWYATVNCTFNYKGVETQGELTMQVTPKDKGFAWTIVGCNLHLPVRSSNDEEDFLHPMSHATDFMSLRTKFDESRDFFPLLANSTQLDQLTVLLYEMKLGNLSFAQTNEIRYHFLQVPGWIFTVENFNRSSSNSGWLIESLIQVNDKEDKRLYLENVLGI